MPCPKGQNTGNEKGKIKHFYQLNYFYDAKR